MRALIRTGTPKTLSISTTHPKPTPKPHAYLISTRATALTREELTWPEPLENDIPVPGYDVAGVVESLPTEPGTYKFKVGDEVYGLTAFTNQGNAREITEATREEIALKPGNMGWEESASVPLSALSAWQGLFIHGGLEAAFEDGDDSANKNKRVLVTAASGGVGIWGVQLAHLAGAEIVATCGTSNVEFVKKLGAETVLDYRKTDLLEWVGEDKDARGFDLVLDCKGGQVLSDAWKCTKPGGKVVSVAEPADKKKPQDGVAEGVESVWFIVKENGDQLAAITKLIEQGNARGAVDSVFKLEQWEQAFEKLEGGHAIGKVVLRL